jgi:thiamine pyrophosphate-dependent acetolactate synthase large subunit-like protein
MNSEPNQGTEITQAMSPEETSGAVVGDLLTQVERKTSVVHILLNNESLDFVSIEQQEAGFIPYGVGFKNPNFAALAEAMGAKGIRIEEPDSACSL